MSISQRTCFVTIIILHTITFSMQQGYLQSGQCEPIRIPMCQSMPWNETKMPNLMDQTSQQNAILKIEEYAPLVRDNCSERLPFFLCSIFAPICWSAHDIPKVKPCREVCQQVRNDCEPVIQSRYNRTWPADIDCDSFPRYNEGICISPEAIQRQTGTTVAPVKTTQEPCNCKKKTRFHIRRYIEGKLKMVLRVKVISSKQIGKLYLTQINVIKILKNGEPNFSLDEGNTLMFWTKRKSCRGQVCPDVRERKEYILACNRIQKGGRLIFDPEICMISRWKDKWIQTIANWERIANLPKSSRKVELRNIRHSKKNKYLSGRATSTLQPCL